MSTWRCMTLVLLLTLALGSESAALAPGDTIRLQQRNNHIPAHPAPGDHQVHLRFLSDSVATVLNLDALTGWVEIRGMRTQGGPGTGWITPRYIVTTLPDDDGDHGTDGHINWCPAKGAVQPHASGRLRLATWNLANLHSQNGQSIFSDSEKRHDIDYERIRCYVRLMDPDILAVQEVDGAAALQRVVDTDVYDVHVSSRLQGSVGKQNTGFAYRKGLQVRPQPDVTTLNTSGGLRHGTRIDLTHNGRTLKLMSVHLKSGCFSNTSSGAACASLMAQIPPLEQWIDTAAADTEPFIVLGDFNRRLKFSYHS